MKKQPIVLELSDAQLDAYNRRDIDAFCRCYHDDVVVLDERGQCVHQGIEAFRTAYTQLFETHEIHAWITERIHIQNHVVEKETWQRTCIQTGEKSGGDVIVRYTEKEQKIAIVEFLR